jgi:hypothetical protein
MSRYGLCHVLMHVTLPVRLVIRPGMCRGRRIIAGRPASLVAQRGARVCSC